MRDIIWVDVVERDPLTDTGEVVVQTYPFPDVTILKMHSLVSISDFKDWIEEIDDRIVKECYKTRLHFIMVRWHPKNFLNVELKPWKYNT